MSYDFAVPSTKEYIKVLKSLKKKLSPEQKRMLEVHFRTMNYSLTYGQLAQAIEVENYQAAYDAYETLGKTMGEALNIDYLESGSRPGEPLFASAIGSGNPYRKEDENYFLVMHRELADALRTLKWFK